MSVDNLNDSTISIILARASWCPHCVNFEPIYTDLMKKYDKGDKIIPEYLKKLNIKFVDFDCGDPDVKNTFDISHPKAKIEGYPSVLINIRNKTSNTYHDVPHTQISHDLDKTKQVEEASKRFMENIINSLKTIESGGSVKYTQTGGGRTSYTPIIQETYRNKYLKYKSKYLELKQNEK